MLQPSAPAICTRRTTQNPCAEADHLLSVLLPIACRVTVANLILEYILANAAAIRGFAPYFSMLVNQPADKFITPWQGYNLDWCVG
jgi:hypothetical protein